MALPTSGTECLGRWISECSRTLSPDIRQGVLRVVNAPDAAAGSASAATMILALAHIDRSHMPAGWVDGLLGLAPAGVGGAVVPAFGVVGQAAGGGAAQSGGPYTGVLARVHEKGFGFIQCAPLHAQYNRDVLVQRSECEQLVQGQQVQFYVDVSADGKLTARGIAVVQPLQQQQHAAAATLASAAAYPPSVVSSLPPAAKRPRTDDGSYTDDPTTFHGSVARVHEKGFGFINCAEVTAKYNRDALITTTDMAKSGFSIGSCVEFKVRMKEDGKVTAFDVLHSTQYAAGISPM